VEEGRDNAAQRQRQELLTVGKGKRSRRHEGSTGPDREGGGVQPYPKTGESHVSRSEKDMDRPAPQLQPESRETKGGKGREARGAVKKCGGCNCKKAQTWGSGVQFRALPRLTGG